ncbi:hypothetical protein DSO57_1032642 [Entomophthora muscae]|uniref:Uncharacterized protein n=1 Tax=Entomophthora muscae TaxID=34485 RepID=A0ACC2SPH9_9FUNG|nr:hypothetical protein DSO57_1032642 [Entomophthora muscae]
MKPYSNTWTRGQGRKRARKEEGNKREGDDVTSDKLLLTMLIGKPQLQDLNPDTLQAASLQDQLPGVKTQQSGEYFSKIRYQFGDLESCERHHNGVDRHHSSEDLGVYVIKSQNYWQILYTGVYSYGLGGVGQHQCGSVVLLGGV